MKKRYNSIIYPIVIFLLVFTFKLNLQAAENQKKSTNSKACNSFYSAVLKSSHPSTKTVVPNKIYTDLGFDLKLIYKNKEWIYERDKKGNLIVGQIYNLDTASKIKPTHSLVSLNGKKITSAEQYYSIVDNFDSASDGKKTNRLTFLDQDSKPYTVDLLVSYNTHEANSHEIEEYRINKIDIKNGYYELFIKQKFQKIVFKEDNLSEETHIMRKLAENTIIGHLDGEDKRYFYYICHPSEDEFKKYEFVDHSGYNIANVIKDDNDLAKKNIKIIPYGTKVGNSQDGLVIHIYKTNVFQIKNHFNLKSFPFDKQTLSFSIWDDVYNLDSRILESRGISYEVMDIFMKNDNISGWEKKKYEINPFVINVPSMKDTDYGSGLKLDITLERKHGYYVFKVIFPIILILMVCWAAVWINPKELESRLTITIVCLLSLIAYNFVIDSELPKLEYLTVLDWIILISYIYATIPNFLSVISFKYISIDKKRSELIESLSRRYGAASYILIVFLIILVNTNLNPDFSSSSIAWMSFR